MVTITGVWAKDTFAYVDLDFKIQKGLFAVEGANGSSKTSLFLTLQQGLFNKNTKGCKVEEVNNAVTEGPYEIGVTFIKEGHYYTVINSRKLGRIDVYMDGSPIGRKRIPDNLALISEILGCDFALFADLTLQHKNSTMDLLETGSDKSRKAFINRVLKLSEIDEQAVRLKEKEKELAGKSGRIVFLQKQLETLRGSLGTLLEVPEEMDIGPLEREISGIEILRDALKDDIRDARTELAALLEVVNTWSAELNIRDELARLEERRGALADPDPTAQARLDKLQKSYTDLLVKLAGVQRDMDRAREAEVAKVQQERLRHQAEAIGASSFSKEELTQLVEADNRIIIAESLEMRRLQEKIQELTAAAAKGICPTCGAGANASQFEGEIEKLKEEGRLRKKNYDIRKLRFEEYQELLEDFTRKEKLQQEIEKLAATAAVECDIDTCKRRLQLYEEKKDELEDDLRRTKQAVAVAQEIGELTAKMETLKAKLSGVELPEDWLSHKMSLEIAVSEGTRKVGLLEEELKEKRALLEDQKQHNRIAIARRDVNKQVAKKNAEIQAQIAQAEADLLEAERRLDLLKEWAQILGDKGFRVAKVNTFLRALNQAMRKYSQMICDNRIRIGFHTTPEGEVDFTILDNAKSLPYELWSAGEKARVRLVCLFAVIELLEDIGNVSFNILCLDEVFSELDDDGKTGLFQVLEYLKQRGKSIYTIAHSKLALDVVYDGVIRAVKNEDGTTQIFQ